MQVAVYAPNLLTLDAAALRAQFEGLQSALGVERQHLCHLVHQQPYLLTTPIHRVSGLHACFPSQPHA
jgi:hypothetical protein